MSGVILALDQGTTSSRALVVDAAGSILGVAQREFSQYYPKAGWVEHNAEEIWESQRGVIGEALKKADTSPDAVAAVGITNQRETTIIWDRRSGTPIANAIVWQCRRTAEMCERLAKDGHAGTIQEKTGLVIDAYFSGTKVKWLLDSVEGARAKAEAGALCFGTVDSWLLWKLTGGQVHQTDVTNAARTMLFNIHTGDWDQEILDLLSIPRQILPEVCPSSHIYAETEPGIIGNRRIPIAGMAGDQHAALFGQACFEPGMIKNTYGTGAFVLVNTGSNAVTSRKRLLTTPAWKIGGETVYAMEGSIFIAGAAVQWLRDSLHIIDNAEESEQLARAASEEARVYVVPAFVGLGAPHWDSYARGGILGITAATGRKELVRATLDSIAYQSRDVVEAFRQEEDLGLQIMRVDGGASANDYLMQFQADILGLPVERPAETETTALGAAYLAGLASGIWSNLAEVKRLWRLDRRFEPTMSTDERDALYAGWKKALSRVSHWESPNQLHKESHGA